MPYTTLIETETLASHLNDPTYAIVDCRFSLDDTAWGERQWAERHIPGAVYAHLDRDLSGETTGINGRHPLPDVATMTETFGRFGISAGVQVVAYDQDSNAYASRFWWLLRWLGHDHVAVLNGGFEKWIDEKRVTAAGLQARAAREFVGVPRARAVVEVDEVAALVGPAGWRLVDARAPERFRGEVETIDRVAGHIPGATNYFFKRNLDEGGRFRTPEELRAQLREALGGVGSDRVVCYCGSGVTACHNLLALEHAGLRGARLFPGSWSEWSADPARPVEIEKSVDPGVAH